jgi:hypothetical protein
LANENTPREHVILAIEDDLEDVEILRLALAGRSVQWKVISLQFAKDAILYLDESANLPTKSVTRGRQSLSWI